MGTRQHSNIGKPAGLIALPAVGSYHVDAAYQGIYFVGNKYSLVKGAYRVITGDPAFIRAGGAELTQMSIFFNYRQRRGYYTSGRTVVAVQMSHCDMGIILLKPFETGGIGAAETVNRLIWITYDEQGTIIPLTVPALDKIILDWIRILKFVNKQVGEAGKVGVFLLRRSKGQYKQSVKICGLQAIQLLLIDKSRLTGACLCFRLSLQLRGFFLIQQCYFCSSASELSQRQAVESAHVHAGGHFLIGEVVVKPLSELGRSFIGKGYGADLFRRHMLLFDQISDTADQSAGLTRSGTGNHCYLRFLGYNGRPLFVRQPVGVVCWFRVLRWLRHRCCRWGGGAAGFADF